MLLHIRVALMSATSVLMLGSMIVTVLLIDHNVHQVLEERIDRSFNLLTGSAALQLEHRIDKAAQSLREFRNLATQNRRLLDETPVLARLLAERLRELPEVGRLGYHAAAKANYVGAERTQDQRIVFEHSVLSAQGFLHGRVARADGATGKIMLQRNAEIDNSSQAWFAQAVSTDALMLSGPHRLPDGSKGFTLALRMTSLHGVPLGVFFADFSVAAITEGLTNLVSGKGDEAVLMDFRGNVLAQTNLSEPAGYADAARAAFLEMATDVRALGSQRALTGDHSSQGKQFRVTFRHIVLGGGVDWILAILIPAEQLYAPITHIRSTILTVAAVATLAGLLGAALLSALLSKPLSVLEGEATRIRDLRLENTPPIRSHILEISRLAEAMAAMKSGLRMFGIYVPRTLVESILRSGASTTLGGDRRELTIVFTDLVGFTGMTEKVPPEELMNRLSGYFREMSKAIDTHGGTIDKFIGDAIMAFWNAPVPDPDHATHACRALLACRDVNARINLELIESGMPPLLTRMGAHTGDVIVGNVGSEDRMQYTALGAQVNLASRIENLNKQYGTNILVSHSVYERAGEAFLFRLAAQVMPVGTSIPVAIYELVGASDAADAPKQKARVAAWEPAMAAWQRRDYAAANHLFGSIAATDFDDGLAANYVKRSAAYAASAPVGWDGVDRLEEK